MPDYTTRHSARPGGVLVFATEAEMLAYRSARHGQRARATDTDRLYTFDAAAGWTLEAGTGVVATPTGVGTTVTVGTGGSRGVFRGGLPPTPSDGTYPLIVSNTTDPFDLMSATIPADALGANGMLLVDIYFAVQNATTQPETFNVTVGDAELVEAVTFDSPEIIQVTPALQKTRWGHMRLSIVNDPNYSAPLTSLEMILTQKALASDPAPPAMFEMWPSGSGYPDNATQEAEWVLRIAAAFYTASSNLVFIGYKLVAQTIYVP